MYPTKTAGAGGITWSADIVVVWVAEEFWQVAVPTEIAMAATAVVAYVIQLMVKD